jgi:hypothetical protein
MADPRGNPRRAFRLDDETWEAFRIAAEAHGWDRGALVKDFIDWFTNQPERATYKRRKAAD